MESVSRDIVITTQGAPVKMETMMCWGEGCEGSTYLQALTGL